jgi:hypothetical protein
MHVLHERSFTNQLKQIKIKNSQLQITTPNQQQTPYHLPFHDKAPKTPKEYSSVVTEGRGLS